MIGSFVSIWRGRRIARASHGCLRADQAACVYPVPGTPGSSPQLTSSSWFHVRAGQTGQRVGRTDMTLPAAGISFPAAESAARARLFGFLLAAMRGTVHAGTLFTWAFGVLIVDDNRLFLETARDLLEREGLRVVGVAATSAQALRRAAELRPEVVLVDISSGDESGFDLARRLAGHDRDGGPAVILISTHSEADFADLIAESPAAGFLPKRGAVGGCDPPDRRWRRARRPARRSPAPETRRPAWPGGD